MGDTLRERLYSWASLKNKIAVKTASSIDKLNQVRARLKSSSDAWVKSKLELDTVAAQDVPNDLTSDEILKLKQRILETKRILAEYHAAKAIVKKRSPSLLTIIPGDDQVISAGQDLARIEEKISMPKKRGVGKGKIFVALCMGALSALMGGCTNLTNQTRESAPITNASSETKFEGKVMMGVEGGMEAGKIDVFVSGSNKEIVQSRLNALLARAQQEGKKVSITKIDAEKQDGAWNGALRILPVDSSSNSTRAIGQLMLNIRQMASNR